MNEPNKSLPGVTEALIFEREFWLKIIEECKETGDVDNYRRAYLSLLYVTIGRIRDFRNSKQVFDLCKHILRELESNQIPGLENVIELDPNRRKK